MADNEESTDVVTTETETITEETEAEITEENKEDVPENGGEATVNAEAKVETDDNTTTTTSTTEKDSEETITTTDDGDTEKVTSAKRKAVVPSSATPSIAIDSDTDSDYDDDDNDNGYVNAFENSEFQINEEEEEDLDEDDDDDEDEEEEEEEVDEEEEKRKLLERKELVKRYEAAMFEKQDLAARNAAAQQGIGELFKKKISSNTSSNIDRNIYDQRYISQLVELEQLELDYEKAYADLVSQCAASEEAHREAKEEVDQLRKEYRSLVKKMAQTATTQHNNRPAPAATYKELWARENEADENLSVERMKYIQNVNLHAKRESDIRKKEEVGEGLYLLDFEQLKIENQSNNEKIEEKNEEISRIRQERAATVQILSHVRERIYHTKNANEEAKKKLKEIESAVANRRSLVIKTKKARDQILEKTAGTKNESGLIGNEVLLRDFEKQFDELTMYKEELEALKAEHRQLNAALSNATRNSLQSTPKLKHNFS